MPFVGQLLTLGLAKEVTLGTFVLPPTRFINYVPPASFSPAIQLLMEKAVWGFPDKVVKVIQGVEEFKGMKLKVEMEPENIGEILMATLGVDTKTGPTNTTVYTHTFTRLNNAQLPTYTIWMNQGALQSAFGGCMMNKLDLVIKAKELVTIDADFVGTTYQSSTTQTATFSTIQPFTFATAVVKIAGTQINDYTECKISLNNEVKADHVLNTLITPGKIYSEGMTLDVSLDMYVESGNIAQWSTDYLTGAAQSFEVILTHPANVAGSSPTTPYVLDITMPVINYMTAPFHNVAAALKIPFMARGVYDLGNTNQTIKAVLKNSVSTTY